MGSRLDAVVVHWNQGEACAETLRKLRAHDQVGTVFVVDNGSHSTELERVADAIEELDNAELIALDRNRGFGPGTNVGWGRWLGAATTDWCLTLPHDAYLGAGALAAMLELVDDNPRLGLLSADVGDGMIPIVDDRFGPIFEPQTVAAGFERCDYPHGTMFLASRACLEQIGLYDERFFTYCEEADLGLRATAADWEVGMAVGSRVFNPRVSTDKRVADYLMERNTLLLVGKHYGAWAVTVRAVLAVAQLVRGMAQPSSRTEYWSAQARVLALRDALLRRWGEPPTSLAES